MWGCIVLLMKLQTVLEVPSLYVRVYRIVVPSCWSLWSSLIICEGVSRKEIIRKFKEDFPHYMWGCIAWTDKPAVNALVPSLYVRVYRNKRYVDIHDKGSLIICEGVSSQKCRDLPSMPFPHYMWGCIFLCELSGCVGFVPSLYVRVYRFCRSTSSFLFSSLIICEGVSSSSDICTWLTVFPHYMWGCIVEVRSGNFGKGVPSLYVRVYRTSSFLFNVKSGSLIICEGVSIMERNKKNLERFPHYMWGCIDQPLPA